MMESPLQRSCLKSTNSLKSQLLWSFGTISFITLAAVVILACTSAFLAGGVVKDDAELHMRTQVEDNLLIASRLVGEQLDAYTADLEGTVQLIAEATRDRIVGYPRPGWEDDYFVPFFDTYTQTRKYPLNEPPPPMEWNTTANVNADNAKEHVQERADWAQQLFPSISTATSAYFMQGACNPAEKNTSAQTYYPNCTVANNNFETGGVVQPTSTNRGLYEKSGDLTVFLKALWESQPDALTVGVYFMNSGPGSHVVFPGYHWPGRKKPYQSSGCEWMKIINPYTGRPLATSEEINRCHPNGAIVPQREYNAMERPWCQEFASNPDTVGWYGPYQSVNTGAVILTVGKGIFDRQSGEFIGCVGLDVAVNDFSKGMDSSIINKHSELLLFSFRNGDFIADSLNSNALMRDEAQQHLDLETLYFFREVVNFETPWTAEEAEEAYRSIIETDERGLVTAYPIPVIPEKYDPSYRPRFMVVHSISLQVFGVVDSINNSIDHDVRGLCVLAGVLALFGMIMVLSIVWFMSRMLTHPLLWMEGVAWSFVNHADKCSDCSLTMAEEEGKFSTKTCCTPKTEVNELVSEFQTMIKGFSGEGASKVADSALHEIWNDLTWHSDFHQLYSRHRQEKSNRSTSVGSGETGDSTIQSSGMQRGILQRPLAAPNNLNEGMEDATSLIVPPPSKRNRNHVICTQGGTGIGDSCNSNPIRIQCSPLFWWIVILIVIPLLLLMLLICTVVSKSIISTMPSWVAEVDDAHYELATKALNLTAASKASLLSTVVSEAVRDLHLVTRIAGWLYLGGIKQTASFTEQDTASKDCQRMSEGPSCPVNNSTHKSCECEWNDLDLENCSNYNSTEVRNMQKQFWILQSQDSDPITGRRNNSLSFPAVGSSPDTTQWWDNASLIPGSEKGSQASGYATSYDRLRVVSATAVAKFPVYNFAQQISKFGVYIAFEEDGLMTGVAGCRYYPDMYNFNSTDENRAAVVAPSLCPLGKHGYDPRCRDWYGSGKEQYKNSSSPIHFTASYKLAIKGQEYIATSATTPIANPRTKEYIGQALLLFYPEGLGDGLRGLGHGFKQRFEQLASYTSILITPSVDTAGGDTVVGPNKSFGWESASIMDLLFEYDRPLSSNWSQFEQECLTPMKNGDSGLKEFWRTRSDGTPEHLFIAFAPVYERALLPLSPDDFSRGVEVSQVLLYSVAMIQTTEDMLAPFEETEDAMMSQLDSLQRVYIILTVVVAILFTVFTCIITLYIVTPMITLLRAVQNINRRVVDGDFPPLKGGSREVHGVYNTFAKLYKVVRISNTAFFSGNLKWAYHFVNDALKLFRKVSDQKAVSIACNNLGNTLFAAYYDGVEDIGLEETGEDSLIPLALQHYREAIELGEQEFENTPEIELKADFALQLSDRLFNRGLFLLLIQADDLAPADARQLGFADIRRSRNLDYDVKDFMLEHKLLLKNSVGYFSRLLRRISGLADFNDDIGIHEVWDVKELIGDADQLLFAAWNEPAAPLFKEVDRVGRLQQLEAAAILLWLSVDFQVEAARLAMRMFAEDEYLLEASFVQAADALLKVLRGGKDGLSFSKETVSCTQDDLRRMAKSCKNVSLDVGKCLVFAVELCERWEGDAMLDDINTNCLALYDRHCSANDYMGVVTYSTDESLTIDLTMRGGNEGRQRGLLDIATSSTAERANPTFPLAIQMVVDSQASLENDSYIVLMLDGYAWDSDACSSLRQQIDRLNRERKTSIHLFIIGLDMEDDNAREQCIQLSTVSKMSFYSDATLDTIDSIFDAISISIGRPMNNGFLKGITMERF